MKISELAKKLGESRKKAEELKASLAKEQRAREKVEQADPLEVMAAQVQEETMKVNDLVVGIGKEKLRLLGVKAEGLVRQLQGWQLESLRTLRQICAIYQAAEKVCPVIEEKRRVDFVRVEILDQLLAQASGARLNERTGGYDTVSRVFPYYKALEFQNKGLVKILSDQEGPEQFETFKRRAALPEILSSVVPNINLGDFVIYGEIPPEIAEIGKFDGLEFHRISTEVKSVEVQAVLREVESSGN